MNNINEILAERKKTHGCFENQATLSQSLKECCRFANMKHNLNFSQTEAIEMILHKIARIVVGNPNIQDHWLDISGYATLVANNLGELNAIDSER